MELDDPYIVNITKSIYRLSTRESSCIRRANGNDLSCDKLVSYAYLTNGVCFSLDENKMYFSDTLKGLAGSPRINCIEEYNGKGNIKDMFRLVGIQPNTCHSPHWSCIDSDDCLLNAHCTQSKVCRYDENGNLDIIVNVFERGTTCITFGGKNLHMLYTATLNEQHYK